MKKTLRRISALRACACISILAATLGGCSGGSSGGGTTAPPPPSVTAADFWVAGTSRDGNGADTLHVIDPDKPDSPRLSVSVDDSLSSIAVRYDPASGKITYLPESMVYFVRNHQLFQVSLRKTNDTVAQRISSLDTACELVDWHPLKFDGGDEVWLQVLDAGPDGDCARAEDNRQVFVRTGASTSTAATALPDGVALVEAIPAVNGQGLGHFLMSDSRGAVGKLTLYSAALAPVGEVAGSEGLSSLEFLDTFEVLTRGTSAYVRSGMSLHRLSWTDTGAALTPSLHAFENPPSDDDSVISSYTGTAGTYFIDGLKVKRIDAAGAVVTQASFDAAAGDTLQLLVASPDRLVLVQSSTAGDLATTLLALPIAGGPPLTLASVADFDFAWGAVGGDLLYVTRTPPSQDFTVHRVDVQGHNDRVLARGVGYPMFSYGHTLDSSSFPFVVETLMWCDKGDGEPDCSKGTLKSLNLGTGASATLGQFAHTATTWFAPANFFSEPAVLQAYAYDPATLALRQDIYLVRPGHADSLVRITHNIP